VKRAIVAVTDTGLKTAEKIQAALGGDIYTLPRLCRVKEYRPIIPGLKELMGSIFKSYQSIIMVMACGIVVRSIAPHLASKTTDPAVVVLDEQGQNVISLLSGHLGGANRLAEKVAGITGGRAVITTASDNLGIESVDLMAQRNGLVMEDLDQVKKVTAVLVQGKKVAVVTDHWSGTIDPILIPASWDTITSIKPDGLIYIGNKARPWAEDLNIPVAKLAVPNLVLGVGCRKDTDPDQMENFVSMVFRSHNLSPAGIKTVATVDVKKNEKAVIHLARKLCADLKIISREEITSIECQFACSEFVKRTIGVGCVCEPAAFIASGKGNCVVPKTAGKGVTLCVYKFAEIRDQGTGNMPNPKNGGTV